MDEYLPAAVDAETLAANDRTAEERLAAAKMIVSVDEPVPTVAGVLVMGRRPQHFLPGAYVQFLRIAGREWGGEVVDEARCEGPVADLVLRVDDKLIAHNRTAVELISAPTETRRSTYPLGALQQLVRNAVMHRTYDGTNAPVHVYWFDDRIEINSPGGPYRRSHARELRASGGDRLSQPDAGGSNARTRPSSAALRVRHSRGAA